MYVYTSADMARPVWCVELEGWGIVGFRNLFPTLSKDHDDPFLFENNFFCYTV
jgi:hypothetical protein